ncbi:MAG: glucose-6-phosphate isomerase [Flavobacteriaceae bacterium]|nr:glucose-6-phosphate isomerase [Flavobacteriaceae bacterium]MDG1912467.1 glucose-6-phosphate isomerase [Flavobacteriaceae bacterium]
MHKILPNSNPTALDAWESLKQHFQNTKHTTLREHFKEEPNRLDYTVLEWEEFYVDFSKNRLDKKGFDLLLKLAKESGLKEAIAAQFSGNKINVTEDRAVLHTALRTLKKDPLLFEGENVLPALAETQQKMYAFCDNVISGAWKGYTGKAITHIVNIGIGGSDLGPAMVVEALEYYKNHLDVRFVSNVEGDHHQEVIKDLNPETTLFVIVSKTFTTQETLSNANSIRAWFLNQAPEQAVAQHFVAVSTNTEKTAAFGISAENTFPMNDWVGGRFSLWSTVGLSICLAVGPKHFTGLLEGAGKMDAHFQETPFDKNIPVVLALISVWYNNFWNAESEAIIPYTQYLRNLPAYLQQGIMESNGKSVGRDGKRVNYQTGTLIWGASGTNAQHAFFQLIHQGTKLIPADFIGFKKALHGNKDHQEKLLANFIAQTEALMNGKTLDQVKVELNASGMSPEEQIKIAPFKVFEGNKPTNTLLIDSLTPNSLGALIALYEHKIFVQGILWNIYSYDQWGVELGKQLANVVLEDIKDNANHPHDKSTQALLKHISD